MRIKGARGDQFFINRESVERYAEELRQIEAVATIGAEPRHDAQQLAVARNSAPASDSATAAPGTDPAPAQTPTPDSQVTIQRLEGEVLNLRIDNRGKEQAINFLTAQAREKDQHLHDLSYRLGASETRLAQLEAPKAHDDQERQTRARARQRTHRGDHRPSIAVDEPREHTAGIRARTAATHTAPINFRQAVWVG